MKASVMNSESADADKCQVLNDVAQVILAVSDHIPPSQKFEMDTMLIADLALESIELASLIFRLGSQYSGSVSLADFMIGIESTGRMPDLSVGSIVDFIADSLQSNPADTVAVPELGTGQVNS
jgi:hypothetical protein